MCWIALFKFILVYKIRSEHILQNNEDVVWLLNLSLTHTSCFVNDPILNKMQMIRIIWVIDNIFLVLDAVFHHYQCCMSLVLITLALVIGFHQPSTVLVTIITWNIHIVCQVFRYVAWDHIIREIFYSALYWKGSTL